MKFSAIILGFVFSTIFSELSLPKNPFITSGFYADPSAHVGPDGRLYLYPSHDIAPPRGCDLMDKYHVFSTDDLVNWVDHGQILENSQLEWGSVPGFMWAPDCVYKNGLYYFYFPHPSDPDDRSNSWKIGVAISKEPAANFVSAGYIPDIPSAFDPCVFTDDDGQSYLVIGGAQKCFIGKLGEDMLSVVGEMSPLTLPNFHEGPWLFKRKDIYYMMYPDGTTPNNLQLYATSTAGPLGPWTYRGVVYGDTGCDTSHGSIVEYKGEWLLFYHSAELSGMGNLRSVNVAKINFTEDGEIIRYDPPIPALPKNEPKPTAAGTTYGTADLVLGGTTSIETSQGVSSVRNLHIEGNYVTFPRVDGGRGGQVLLYINFATNDGGSFLKAKINGEYIDAFMAHSTGGWDDYTGYAHIGVELKAGQNEIVLEGGYGGINLVSLIVIQ